ESGKQKRRGRYRSRVASGYHSKRKIKIIHKRDE
ncbi:hypothetical protein Csa_024008, partial [Cucumis sativus]